MFASDSKSTKCARLSALHWSRGGPPEGAKILQAIFTVICVVRKSFKTRRRGRDGDCSPPPLRSRRALLTHRAPPSAHDVDPAHPSIAKPLSDWLDCYGPVFISVPVRIMEGGCYLFDGIMELRAQINKFESALAEVIGLWEVVRLKEKVEGEIERLKSEVFHEAVVAGLGEFDKLAGTPSMPLYKALNEHVSPDDVNREFSSDPSGQGLPLIPDAGARILAEMGVRDGAFDFSVVQRDLQFGRALEACAATSTGERHRI
jgi:hypothetical protein